MPFVSPPTTEAQNSLLLIDWWYPPPPPWAHVPFSNTVTSSTLLVRWMRRCWNDHDIDDLRHLVFRERTNVGPGSYDTKDDRHELSCIHDGMAAVKTVIAPIASHSISNFSKALRRRPQFRAPSMISLHSSTFKLLLLGDVPPPQDAASSSGAVIVCQCGLSPSQGKSTFDDEWTPNSLAIGSSIVSPPSLLP